jgi:hypothetical protein
MRSLGRQSVNILSTTTVDSLEITIPQCVDTVNEETCANADGPQDNLADDIWPAKPRTRRLASVFNVASRWRITAEDAAELMVNVERASTPELQYYGCDQREIIGC